jgi:hypothetical protein
LFNAPGQGNLGWCFHVQIGRDVDLSLLNVEDLQGRSGFGDGQQCLFDSHFRLVG